MITPTPSHIAEAERMARAVIQFVSPMNEASCLQYIPKVLAGLDLPQLIASRDECERLRKEMETAARVTSEMRKTIDQLRAERDEFRDKLRIQHITTDVDIETAVELIGECNELKRQLKELRTERDELQNQLTGCKLLKAALRQECDKRLSDLSVENARVCNEMRTLVTIEMELRTREAALMSAMRPENPYPQSVFPMTEAQYVKAIPDEAKRTAISGLLMRKGWQVYQHQIKEALAKAGVEVK